MHASPSTPLQSHDACRSRSNWVAQVRPLDSLQADQARLPSGLRDPFLSRVRTLRELTPWPLTRLSSRHNFCETSSTMSNIVHRVALFLAEGGEESAPAHRHGRSPGQDDRTARTRKTIQTVNGHDDQLDPNGQRPGTIAQRRRSNRRRSRTVVQGGRFVWMQLQPRAKSSAPKQ